MTVLLKRTISGVALVALLTILPLDAQTSAPAEAGKVRAPGGAAVAHYAGGKRVSSRRAKSAAPRGVLYPVGANALEPTMGVAKNGDVFYIATPSLGAEVMKSTDNGKSWKPSSPQIASQNSHPVTLDPYIYIDKWTQRIFTIDLTVACSYLSFSDDGGSNWTTNPLACGVPVNDHQTLFSGPPVSSSPVGYKNLVYYCYNAIASATNCTKSLDGGLTFIPTGELAYNGFAPEEGDPGGCAGLNGHGVVGSDGTVYVPKETCDQPLVLISKDEGLSWTSSRVSSMEAVWGPDPSVAVDAKGNIYYVFIAEKDRLPYLVTSTDGGRSWSDPRMIALPGLTETVHATLDVGAPGKVAVAYYGTDDVDGPMERRDYKDATWNGYMTMTTDALSDRPLFFSASINTPSDPLMKGACGPRRCYDALDFIDVVIGSDGTPWSAFVANCFKALCPAPTPPEGETSGIVGRLTGGPKLR